MGGFGVMTYAARHPDVFVAAASLSGAVDSNYGPFIGVITAAPGLQGAAPDSIFGDRATQEIRWHGHNPTDLAENLRDVDLQVRTFEGAPNPTTEGGPDSAVGCIEERGIHDMNISFRTRLLELKIPHVWKNYGPGCHGIPEFRKEFADALPGIAAAFVHPRPAPKTFTYRSIEPHFTVWGWRVDADPARPLEFLQLQHAGRGGLTLTGSGTTRVTTPPFFRGRRAVDLVGAGATHTLRPGRGGRLRFSVALDGTAR